MNVKFIKVASSKLSSVPIADGQVIVCTDKSEIYYDMNSARNRASSQSNSSNYGLVKLSDNYTSSSGAASAGVGASSKAVSDSYTDLLNKMTSGLKVDYFTLANGEYTRATSTKTTWTTHSSRKFSDYEYLNFELIVGQLVRATLIVPRRRFSTYSIELTYVDSTNTQFWVNVAFVTDTSYAIYSSSNIPSTAYVCITGLKSILYL